MAQDLGNRLLPAFHTPTGLPYPRVNLLRGMDEALKRADVTCTACAGSIIMEFAALSRYTQDPKYEVSKRLKKW